MGDGESALRPAGGPAAKRAPAHAPIDDEGIARVVAEAERAELELVRFLYVDHGGIVRGKATSRATLADRMRTGIGLTVAMQAMSMLDELQPVDGLGPVGEIRLVPDPATFVTLPYAPGAGAMLADMRRLDGAAWEACDRSFLKTVIADAARDGVELVAAFEPEFTLASRVGGADGVERLVPVDESLCFSGTGFTEAHEFTIDLVRALNAQGLTVELYYPELGHGQQELSIRHADALATADRHVLYRETARGVARRHGLWASLAPKPIADQAGNGAHVHCSLWDAGPAGSAAGNPAAGNTAADNPEARNLFFDPHDRLGLSDTAYHFIGGLLAHLPGLLALTCGSVNSYRRLQPMHWSSAFVCYGMDNREAAVRIASPMWGRTAASTNLELKASDSSANPYLALGGVLAAGMDGVRRALDPGDPVDVDPGALSEAERRRRGIARFPTSLGEALDALERDELLTSALGALRTSAYLAVKRSEVAAFAARDAEYECLQHALRI
jgi:glutamine synthetase